ncbi:MAG: gliding motility-associated ABC transporter permease subunit GldF [Cytophagales bacterium]
MLSILIKEFNSFLDSTIAYVVIILFLLGTGLFLWVFPDTSILEYGYADLDSLFSMTPFIYMFLIPAITMKSFSEELKGGSMELILTKPLTDWQIILGKYFAGLSLVLVSLAPTLVYYYSVYQLGFPKGNVDSAGVVGSYIGLVFLGAVFTSVGIFTSSISDSQIISFIVGVFLCFLLHTGFSALSKLEIWGTFSSVVESFGIDYHYYTISKGLLDSRDILYFLSIIFIMLKSTHLLLSTRKW